MTNFGRFLMMSFSFFLMVSFRGFFMAKFGGFMISFGDFFIFMMKVENLISMKRP